MMSIIYLISFGVVCTVLMMIAFRPAWHEWRTPSDCEPLDIRSSEDDEALFPLDLDEGTTFLRINAPMIRFGERGHNQVRTLHPDLTVLSLARIRGAIRRTDNLFLVKGDCVLPAGRVYRGSLVVTGKLTIGKGTRVLGDIKARKAILVESEALVGGALVCENKIHIETCAQIKGPLVSETSIFIDSHVNIGLPEAPTTIAADEIVIRPGVIAYGSVAARSKGLICAR